MSKAEALAHQKEEAIRLLVRELPDEKRGLYFRRLENKIKDPDTYATLNYIFVAGLHHFYIGRWKAGMANIGAFLIGIAAFYFGHIEIGIAFILAISVFEVVQLINSQVIIKQFNNDIAEAILAEITQS